MFCFSCLFFLPFPCLIIPITSLMVYNWLLISKDFFSCRFIIGFFLAAIPWYVGAIILLCSRVDYREKPGYIACTVAVSESMSLHFSTRSMLMFWILHLFYPCEIVMLLVLVKLNTAFIARLDWVSNPWSLLVALTPIIFQKSLCQ